MIGILGFPSIFQIRIRARYQTLPESPFRSRPATLNEEPELHSGLSQNSGPTWLASRPFSIPAHLYVSA